MSLRMLMDSANFPDSPLHPFLQESPLSFVSNGRKRKSLGNRSVQKLEGGLGVGVGTTALKLLGFEAGAGCAGSFSLGGVAATFVNVN